MVDTKIARPIDGRQKNKSPKEGTDGELYGWHEITRQIDGWHKNNSPRGWTDRVKWLAQNQLAKGMD